MLIVLEGLDGTGKSTLVEKLYEHEWTNFDAVMRVKEPGDGIKEVRDIVLNYDIQEATRELLFYADALELKLKIEQAAKDPDILVLADRSELSHWAYLAGLVSTKQIPYDIAQKLRRLIPDLCNEPAGYIYLYADLDALRAIRWSRRERDRIESNPPEFFKAVSYEYETRLRHSGIPYVRIPGINDLQENIDRSIRFIESIRSNYHAD